MRRLPIAVTSDQFAITILFVFINKVPCQIFLIGAEQGATSPNIISFIITWILTETEKSFKHQKYFLLLIESKNLLHLSRLKNSTWFRIIKIVLNKIFSDGPTN